MTASSTERENKKRVRIAIHDARFKPIAGRSGETQLPYQQASNASVQQNAALSCCCERDCEDVRKRNRQENDLRGVSARAEEDCSLCRE
jgi:hypothetical protein